MDGRVRKASSQNGSLCSQAINVPKAKGVSRDVLEILDELLFWENEFNSSEPKTVRFAQARFENRSIATVLFLFRSEHGGPVLGLLS